MGFGVDRAGKKLREKLKGLRSFPPTVHSIWFRVEDLGFGVQGLGFKVEDLGFRVQGSGFRVSGFGFRIWFENLLTTC